MWRMQTPVSNVPLFTQVDGQIDTEYIACQPGI